MCSCWVLLWFYYDGLGLWVCGFVWCGICLVLSCRNATFFRFGSGLRCCFVMVGIFVVVCFDCALFGFGWVGL